LAILPHTLISIITLHSRQSPPGKKRTHDFRIGAAGRLVFENNNIKQLSLTIEAASKFLSPQSNGRGAVNLIGVCHEEIESLKNQYKIPLNVAINPFAYVQDRKEYFQRLEGNDVLVMPSLKEGFGLVAWEALGAEIPIIATRSSGFFEFLEQEKLESFVTPIFINGKNDDAGEGSDVSVLTNALQQVFDNYPSKVENARILRKNLEHFTWSEATSSFCSLVEKYILGDRPNQDDIEKLDCDSPDTIELDFELGNSVLPIYDGFEVQLCESDGLKAFISRLHLGLPVNVTVNIIDKIDYNSLIIKDGSLRREDIIESAHLNLEKRRSSLENLINTSLKIILENYGVSGIRNIRSCLQSLGLRLADSRPDYSWIDVVKFNTNVHFKAQVPNVLLDKIVHSSSFIGSRPVTISHGYNLFDLGEDAVIANIIPTFVICQKMRPDLLTGTEFRVREWVWGES